MSPSRPDGSVLVSTHDLPLAGRIREGFREEGYRVELVTPGESLERVTDPLLLVLTGGLGAEETQDQVEGLRPDRQVPLFAVVDDAEGGVRERATRLGVDELFLRPADASEIVLLGRRIVERRHLQEVTGIVGETDAIRQALERVVQIAPVDSTVLLTGESGTGKELVARGIHALSPRRHRPFIAVNVAALSDTLLESELFGHEKGAFTGAVDARRGLFELAHSGTIFLDEIGEMPLATQTKLLRVLEQREFHRVGGESPIRVDVRVIAATNQDLRQLVAIGDFRRDLYFRLNVLSIELPPLRERKGDIPRLVAHFIRDATRRHERTFEGITPEAMEVLEAYRWPGNVRELRNLVESMVVLGPGREIRPADIPPEIREPGAGRSLLPVSRAVRSGGDGEAPSDLRPELEFVFRTLMELRMDVDDLRGEFERYRKEREEGRTLALPAGEGGWEVHLPARAEDATRVPGSQDEARVAEPTAASRTSGEEGAPPEGTWTDEGVVVYEPGMTMEELEREAIVAALSREGGNRRRAAESLGIGERTLYRKIKKYDLEV